MGAFQGAQASSWEGVGFRGLAHKFKFPVSKDQVDMNERDTSWCCREFGRGGGDGLDEVPDDVTGVPVSTSFAGDGVGDGCAVGVPVSTSFAGDGMGDGCAGEVGATIPASDGMVVVELVSRASVEVGNFALMS